LQKSFFYIKRELADAIHVRYQRINELVNQKRGVMPSTALLHSSIIDSQHNYSLFSYRQVLQASYQVAKIG
jgi:plasmid maintenance system antidote protein VapI